MRKNFITNISFLLLLNLLIKPFWILGIDRGVQNALGPEVYGVYFALFNFSYVFQVILDFGINNYNNRLIARSPEKLGAQLFSTLVLKIGLGIAYVCVLGIAAHGVGFSSGEELRLLGQLALLQIGLSFYAFLRSNVNALHLFKTDAALSVLDKGITSILCGLVLWTNFTGLTLSIPLFIWLQIIGYGISILIALMIIGRQQFPFSFRIDIPLIKSVLSSSLPYALLGFLMTAYYRTDGVLLERLLGGSTGDYQAGVYASAFRLLDAMNILGFLFAGLLMPMFSRMLASGEAIRQLLQLGFTLMFIASAGAGVSFWWFQEQIMHALYPDADAQAGIVFGWLMISFILISITYVFGSLLTAHGSIRLLNYISLAGFSLNILLNVLLIPEWMSTGSAIATACTQGLVLGAHILLVKRIFPGAIGSRIWLSAGLYIGGMILTGWLANMLSIHWFYALTGTLICSIPLSLLTGLIRIGDLKMSVSSLAEGLQRRTGA